MSTPRVSIGLPVYNGEKYLAEAIESVLAQTFGDFELVISDNGSTDGTPALCHEFAARDRRVRYFRHEENRGAAWNFNCAFEVSEGEYFKWLAHDDVIGPRYLERTIAVLDADGHAVLCHSRTGIIDEQGTLVGDDGSEDFETWELQGVTATDESQRLTLQRSVKANDRYLGTLLYSIRNHEVFGLIRRAEMQKTGLHRAYRGGEKVFLSELSLMGAFQEVPEKLSFSRWHDDRFSSNASAKSQILHVNTKGASRLRLPRQVRATMGYFGAVNRRQICLAERAGCYLVLARFLLQTKKWRTVLSEYLGGSGQLATLSPTPSSGNVLPAAKRHWSLFNAPQGAPIVGSSHAASEHAHIPRTQLSF